MDQYEPPICNLSEARAIFNSVNPTPYQRLTPLEDFENSKRTPGTPKDLNTADRIEWYMEIDHHQTWGFVIYRTTYNSDADWTVFLQHLRSRMESSLTVFNGLDILDSFTLTVLEDRSLFDGASADTVRRHFQQWSLDAFQAEQRTAEQLAPRIGQSPRYRYCIQVDADSLASIIHDGSAPEVYRRKTAWVKIIDKSWYLGRSVGTMEELEPIEGLGVDDVGWMKISFENVMTEWYTRLWQWNFWTSHYQRPPRVVN